MDGSRMICHRGTAPQGGQPALTSCERATRKPCARDRRARRGSILSPARQPPTPVVMSPRAISSMIALRTAIRPSVTWPSSLLWPPPGISMSIRFDSTPRRISDPEKYHAWHRSCGYYTMNDDGHHPFILLSVAAIFPPRFFLQRHHCVLQYSIGVGAYYTISVRIFPTILGTMACV